MKLNPEFMSQQIGDSTILVPVGDAGKQFHGIVQMNETAAFIIECLKEETTEAEIQADMLDAYEATEEELSEAIWDTLEKLRECGALVE